MTWAVALAEEPEGSRAHRIRQLAVLRDYRKALGAQQGEKPHHLSDALVEEDRLELGILREGFSQNAHDGVAPLFHAEEDALSLRRERDQAARGRVAGARFRAAPADQPEAHPAGPLQFGSQVFDLTAHALILRFLRRLQAEAVVHDAEGRQHAQPDRLRIVQLKNHRAEFAPEHALGETLPAPAHGLRLHKRLLFARRILIALRSRREPERTGAPGRENLLHFRGARPVAFVHDQQQRGTCAG